MLEDKNDVIDDDAILEEEETEGEDEEQSEYDAKEEEAREEIRDMFLEVVEELQKTRTSISFVLDKEPELVAGKYRVMVDKKLLNSLAKMETLNELIQESNIYLKNYIDFGDNQNPKFDYLKNLLVKFQESLMEEQNRRFAIIKARDNKYYITKGIIDYYLKGIHVWISRIIGTLKSAGDYIVVVPPKREMPHELGGIGGVGGVGADGVDYGEDNFVDRNPYANSTDWWKKNNDNNYASRGTKTVPSVREFGDKNTK